MENEAVEVEATVDTDEFKTETVEPKVTKEAYNKAVELLAGSERNEEAIMEHYSAIEKFVEKYLAKYEETNNITFDSYLNDLLVFDLMLHDIATFMGHMKLTAATLMSKMMTGKLTEEQQNKGFLKLIKIEKDLQKIMDEDYYEVVLAKQIKTIIEKAESEGLTVFKSKEDEGETSESE
jgi:hypothetical protein